MQHQILVNKEKMTQLEKRKLWQAFKESKGLFSLSMTAAMVS